MQIIDFHNHIYPEQIAEKATQSICDFYELEGGGTNGTASVLLERGREAGIEKFVVLPVGMRPDHVRHVNEFILRQCEANDCFIGFGTVHAAMEDLCGEVEFIAASGLRGIKMHPDFQRFNIDDERLFPMYDMVRGKLPVMLHMGDYRYDYSRPERLRRLLKLFPGLEIVGAHFGGWSLFDTAYENLHDMDCVMDISSSLMFMEKEQAVKLIRAYGPERLMYGTDFPLWDPVKEMERFMQLDLTDDEREQIFCKTAQRVLKV